MATPTQAEINRVIDGYNQARESADYAETLVLQTEQISEDEYRMKWSNKYTGDFVPDAEQED